MVKIPNVLRGEGYQARAVRGSLIMATSYVGQSFIRLASNLVLTRLLFPEAFGLMALVAVVLSGVAMFSDFGFRDSVVQDERGDDPEFLNTAWTLQILRGLVLGLLVLLLAQPLAAFYEEPQLAPILMLSAVMPVLQGLNATSILTADRQLTLGRLTVMNVGTQVLGLLATIALAWWLQSVWALVIGNLITVAIMAALSHVMLPGIRNRLRFERDAVSRLFNFGKYIFFSTLAMFFIQQSDKIVLGKYVSLGDLAIYNIAYLFAAMPMLFATVLAERVIYPLYARRPPKESETNRRKINKARFLLTGTLILGTGCLALIGKPMIEFLYDPRYWGAGPILSLVAIATFPRMIVLSYEKLPLASGDARSFAVMRLTHAALQIGLTILGVQQFGLFGAILASALAIAVVYPLLVRVARKHQGWDPVHDGVGFVLGLAVAAGVVWVYGDTLLLGA